MPFVSPGIPGLENKIKGQTLTQIFDGWFSGDITSEQPVITQRLNKFEAQMDYGYIAGFERFITKLDKKFRLFSGNVIVAMTCAELGKTGFLYGSDYNYYLNQRVGLVVGDDEKKELYLNCLFLTKKFQNVIYEKGYGSAQANISSDDIEQIEIVIPTDDELRAFNSFAIHIYKNLIKNSEEKHQLLKLRNFIF